jgi:polysaccharide export outer membrane protein
VTPQHGGSHRIGLLVLLAAFSLLCMFFSTTADAQTPAPGSAAEYRLAAGDTVRITLEARISERGLVSYPQLGNIKISGLSMSAAEALVAESLKSRNFVRAPQVSVLVTQVRGNQASVLGQVNRPGRYPIEVADLRLSDLLAMAGGIAANGADTVTLAGTRCGQRIREEVDLANVFRNATGDDDLMVLNGDVVYVRESQF